MGQTAPVRRCARDFQEIMKIHGGSNNFHWTFRKGGEFGQKFFRARHVPQFNGPKVRVEFWLCVFEPKAIPCRIDMASDATNGGPHDEVKTVTIRTFGSHEAAELAVTNLEAHGIECLVNADDCGGCIQI